MCVNRATNLRWLGVVSALAALAGCMSLEEMAPPVSPPLVQAASLQGADAESLHRGRAIYLDQCIKCHTVEPVNKYSLAHWDEILPEMSDEAKLSPQQRTDVKAYILAAPPFAGRKSK